MIGADLASFWVTTAQMYNNYFREATDPQVDTNLFNIQDNPDITMITCSF